MLPFQLGPTLLRYVYFALVVLAGVAFFAGSAAMAGAPPALPGGNPKHQFQLPSRSLTGRPPHAARAGLLSGGESMGAYAGSLRADRAASGPGAIPVTSPTPGCNPGFGVVPSPDQGTTASFLLAVSAVAPDDIWAVGYYYVSAGGRQLPFSEHWNGSSWNIVLTPVVGTDSSLLLAVSARASNDVWAVGVFYTFLGGGIVAQTLAEHFDGTAWSVVPSPNPGDPTVGDEFLGVVAVAANDVWAIGDYDNGSIGVTLAAHWDGSAWSVVQTPNPGDFNNVFIGISASASNDVWAVGRFVNASSNENFALAEHWDGTHWSVAFNPNPGAVVNVLEGVSARNANDVWAVGEFSDPLGPQQNLIEHWNGTEWSVIPSPSLGNLADVLYSVSALSANSAWAVGMFEVTHSSTLALALHWDGSNWSVVPNDNPGPDDNRLQGVVALAGSNVWAVGSYRDANSFSTLAERHNGDCAGGTPTSTPTATPVGATATNTARPTATNTPTATPRPLSPTQTPGGPTATPVPPTATGVPPIATSTFTPLPTQTPGGPTATPPPLPTICAIQFSDVPVGSTFYSYVRCLACRGIINGYSDGSFKPNSNVTRGQLSKFVSNAAGFSDAQPNQMFEDVPVGSTFQLFVGRLASRGYIGGYPCGGPGEPCNPNQDPYFRPNGTASRGQLAKIDSNAANYQDPPVGQTFADVPPGSTFYTYTQRLATRNIMSGYPCGGPGEPCDLQHRPYFRPAANVTRGQTSKIVANTFFPDCNPPDR